MGLDWLDLVSVLVGSRLIAWPGVFYIVCTMREERILFTNTAYFKSTLCPIRLTFPREVTLV